MTTESDQNQFCVFAEVADIPAPLIITHLPFGRLMDEIVVPYQSGRPFFIDGAPVKADKLRRIKIIQQKPHFHSEFCNLHLNVRSGSASVIKIFADQYSIRLEALLRGAGVDVTSQIIQAYDATIKLKLTDYLPNRQTMIDAALQVFTQSMKMLGG